MTDCERCPGCGERDSDWHGYACRLLQRRGFAYSHDCAIGEVLTELADKNHELQKEIFENETIRTLRYEMIKKLRSIHKGTSFSLDEDTIFDIVSYVDCMVNHVSSMYENEKTDALVKRLDEFINKYEDATKCQK